MLSRVFVARGISCLTSSAAITQRKLISIPRRPVRFLSTDNRKTEESIPIPEEVNTVTNVETIKNDGVASDGVSIKTEETPAVAPSSESSTEEKSPDVDKQFLEDLLSSISVEAKTAKQRKQLVFDFATIMMDPSFKQLYSSLSKSLPPQYFNDKGLLSTIKKEFISRIQEEIIEGSFLPLDPDPSLTGLSEKKKEMVKDNEIIQSADTEEGSIDIPIPSWIWKEVMGEKEESEEKMEEKSVESSEKTEESSEKVEEKPEESKKPVKPHKEHYDTNKNSSMEERIDTFGEWPFKNPEETQSEPKKKRGEHPTGSFITKNIIINKAGERIAYGGGKRKNATARVFIRNGTGNININGKKLIEQFPMGQNRDQVLAPLAVTLTFQKFDIFANVNGGSSTGQSQAIRIGLAKALSHYDPTYSVLLSKAGLLTADPRKVERKKPGHRKARKPQQWVKR